MEIVHSSEETQGHQTASSLPPASPVIGGSNTPNPHRPTPPSPSFLGPSSGYWSPAETLVLSHAVLKFGESNWNAVSKAVKDFTEALNANPLESNNVIQSNDANQSTATTAPTNTSEITESTENNNNTSTNTTSTNVNSTSNEQSQSTNETPEKPQLKPIERTNSSNSLTGRDSQFFAPSKCAKKYYELLDEQPRPKRASATSVSTSPPESPVIPSPNKATQGPKVESAASILADKFKQARIDELKKSIESREKFIKQLKQEIAEIHTGLWDEKILEEENENCKKRKEGETLQPSDLLHFTVPADVLAAVLANKKQKTAEGGRLSITDLTAADISGIADPLGGVGMDSSLQAVVDSDVMDVNLESALRGGARVKEEGSGGMSPAAASPAQFEERRRRKGARGKLEHMEMLRGEEAFDDSREDSLSSAPSTPIPSQLGAAAVRKTPQQLQADLVKAMMKSLKVIGGHKYAYVFAHPVTLEEAPDYDDIIKRRMDLSTLKKNVLEGRVTSASEFWRDLLLMFQNAMIYNIKGSEIYNMAKDMKRFASKEVEPLLAEEARAKAGRGTASPMLTEKRRRTPKKDLDDAGEDDSELDEEDDDDEDDLKGKKRRKKRISTNAKKKTSRRKKDDSD